MLYVVLPLHNDERLLAGRLREIDCELRGAGLAYRIVAVDDGSCDGTGALLVELQERYPLKVLSHARQRGLSATLRTGLVEVAHSAAPLDLVVRLDCAGPGSARRGDLRRRVTARPPARDRRWELWDRVLPALLRLPVLGRLALGHRATRVDVVQQALCTSARTGSSTAFDASRLVR